MKKGGKRRKTESELSRDGIASEIHRRDLVHIARRG